MNLNDDIVDGDPKSNTIDDYEKYKSRVWDILIDWFGNVKAAAAASQSQQQQEVAFDVTPENLSVSMDQVSLL